MFKGYLDLSALLERGEWTGFLVVMLSLLLLVTIRLLGAEWYRYLDRNGKLPRYPEMRHDATLIVICYDEDLDLFQKCMEGLQRNIDFLYRKIGTVIPSIVVIDGVHRHAEKSRRLAKIAGRYATLVYGTETGDKRNSITRAIYEAQQRGLLNGITIICDSDTVLNHDRVLHELLRPFADAQIGGVTTAQTIYNPRTLAERICNWFEEARLNASQRFLSLPTLRHTVRLGKWRVPVTLFPGEQVGCLPGRLIAVRSDAILGGLESFNGEYLFGRKCVPGDDRFLTLLVQKRGLKTILAPRAAVKTAAKPTLWKVSQMWLRWFRTSQRYTILNPWLIWRKPLTAFVYWTDIYATFAVSYLVFSWLWTMVFGGDLAVPLLQALIYSLVGMVVSMGLRQFRYLWEHRMEWQTIPLLFVFTWVATLAKILALYAILTMFNTKWVTRKGADESARSTDKSIWLWYEEGVKLI